MAELTLERLKQVLDYQPHTGLFIWVVSPDRPKRWNTKHAGKVAGGLNNWGHRAIRIDGRKYLAHRLAWLYVHGEWPQQEVDHVNCDKDDNRISNLREASRFENALNRPVQKNNALGLKGTSFDRRKGKFQAQIGAFGRHKWLDYFETKEAAAEAYRRASEEMHGSFSHASAA